jgi:hypothetical protein
MEQTPLITSTHHSRTPKATSLPHDSSRSAILHRPPSWHRGRPGQLLFVPVPSFRQKLTHDSAAPPFPATVVAELSGDVPIRRTMRAFGGLPEQAEGRAHLHGIHVWAGRQNIRPLRGDEARRARVELMQSAMADSPDDSGATVAIGEV